MAWDSTQTSSSTILYTDWNTMVSYIKKGVQDLSIADHDYVGCSATFTSATTVNLGDICYVNGSSTLALAKADSATTSGGMLAMATANIVSTTGAFLLEGFIRDESWSWTVGGTIYISTTGTTGNTMTQTAPASAGNIVRIIGYAYTAKIIYFRPSGTFITV